MSEKAELLAEATRLANNYQTLETIVNGMLAADNSALSAANAKIALLRAALEPMVAEANAQDQRNPHASGHIAIGKFTIDQCRAARTAYEATK